MAPTRARPKGIPTPRPIARDLVEGFGVALKFPPKLVDVAVPELSIAVEEVAEAVGNCPGRNMIVPTGTMK